MYRCNTEGPILLFLVCYHTITTVGAHIFQSWIFVLLKRPVCEYSSLTPHVQTLDGVLKGKG